MIRISRVLIMAMLASGAAVQTGAAELRGVTVNAWDEYLRGVEGRMQARVDGNRPFMWIDEAGHRRSRVRRGEVIVAPLVGRGVQPVQNGLIHDWIGAVFIPNATIKSLLHVVHDYDRYKEIYRPTVIDSESLHSTAADQEFSMVWQRHVLLVNAALQARYRVHDSTIAGGRGYSVMEATRVQQVEDYGRSSEHLLPPDTGSGFIWRIHSISRYEERDGGVYLETEAIALSRDIPVSLRWLVTPVVNRLSIGSLATTLSQTRSAVAAKRVTLAMRDRKWNN